MRHYGQIQANLAESYSAYRAYLYDAAAAMAESKAALNADDCKLYRAAMVKAVADRTTQVLGANGYLADYQVKRLWRDAWMLGGSTNEALQKNNTRLLTRVDMLEP